MVSPGIRPVLGEDLSGEGLEFDLPHGVAYAGGFESSIESADPTEEGAYSHVLSATAFEEGNTLAPSAVSTISTGGYPASLHLTSH